MNVPEGLDAAEALAYRRGYSESAAKYLAAHGSPGVGADAVAWHAEHDERRDKAAHRLGIGRVKAHWKRYGITGREHVIERKKAS